MLDIAYIRDHAATLKEAIQNKQLNPQIVDSVIAADDERRKGIVRQQINQNTDAIKQSADKRPTPEQIELGRNLKAQLQDIEPQLKQVEETFRDLMYQVANPPAEDVPIGKD